MYQPRKDIQCTVTKGGCFEVTSHPLHSNGYPLAYLPIIGGKGKKQMLIHRYIWAKTHGPIPQGSHILHVCDNRLCINPAHLIIGSHQDNMTDKVRKGRQAKGETCGRSKLNEGVVSQILKDHNSTHKALGLKFHISRSQVTRIKARQSWKHIQA
jgi:hypothetical protein